MGNQQIDPSFLALAPDVLTTPPTETDLAKALRLFRAIRSGRHPLTREGVVLTKPGERPIKMKFDIDRDVLVRGIFEAAAKTGRRAGGFEYSLPGEPDRVVGRVGSGISHQTLRDMLARPEEYVGRTAKIKAQEQFPSGAYRAPRFLQFHEDIPQEKLAMNYEEFERAFDKAWLVHKSKGGVIPYNRFIFHVANILGLKDPEARGEYYAKLLDRARGRRQYNKIVNSVPVPETRPKPEPVYVKTGINDDIGMYQPSLFGKASREFTSIGGPSSMSTLTRADLRKIDKRLPLSPRAADSLERRGNVMRHDVEAATGATEESVDSAASPDVDPGRRRHKGPAAKPACKDMRSA